MQIAFRTDASLQIGAGHVIRCLSLADGLRAQGAQCLFICRTHQGHMCEIIRQRGYRVKSLLTIKHQNQQNSPVHSDWLGTNWQTDAEETASAIACTKFDWLVVDHYAIDYQWEEALADNYHQLFVIDDLADRLHSCNLLLDQNLGRKPQDYLDLVPRHCKVLCGPLYALLRPNFSELRPYSLQRRQAQPNLHNLLITMGGVDYSNATGKILQALKFCSLPQESRITVVMGLAAPWIENVRKLAAKMPWQTEVLVNVKDMAKIMADSDLAIGAAGSTSWERCCLGLPTLMVVLAENQKLVAEALNASQAARLIPALRNFDAELILAIHELSKPENQTRMSFAASVITDGHGVDKIVEVMGMFCA